MHPWIVDAAQISIDNLEFFERNLLLTNAKIRHFLSEANKTETIVIAPKGYGKTLLLKAKRLRLSQGSQNLLPKDALVDKPSGTPPTFTAREYGSLRQEEAYWKNLWLLSIALATLKHYGIWLPQQLFVSQNVLDSPLELPCDIFHFLLSVTRNNYFTAITEYNGNVVPEFRKVHSPLTFFIDNVDEFFESMIDVVSEEPGDDVYRQYWHRSQIGLALASRDLNSINNHIKVFASIRKEVFQKIMVGNPLGLQLAGSSVDITYSKSELLTILSNNISIEQGENLCDPNARNPSERFFGSVNMTIHHPTTGDEESIEDYLVRHTLRRPRDIAMIGSEVSRMDPRNRTQEAIKDKINAAATTIVQSYVAEMNRHLDYFDPDILYPLIADNVLTAKELAKISKKYDRLFRKKHPVNEGGSLHVFCNLYKIGLLGYVGPHPEIGQLIQRFGSPGNIPLDSVHVLPRASNYVIHPMLDDQIARYNPKYYRRMNKINIIGYDRVWREQRDIFYVLKGDLRGFNEAMRNPDHSALLPKVLGNLCKSHCSDIRFCKLEQGDSLLLCDENPFQLIDSAQQVMTGLRNAGYEYKFRFGGDAGFVEFVKTNAAEVPKGLAILAAARLEPHAPPGRIVVTDGFKDNVVSTFGHKNMTFTRVSHTDVPKLAEQNGKFNLAKSGGEEELWRELYFCKKT